MVFRDIGMVIMVTENERKPGVGVHGSWFFAFSRFLYLRSLGLIFYNFSALQIKSFFLRFAHGEGLSWQNTVEDNRFEKVVFFHGRKVKTYVARF